MSPALVTVMLSKKRAQDFTDNTAFLTVKMKRRKTPEGKDPHAYALIELNPELDRFIVLPKLETVKT